MGNYISQHVIVPRFTISDVSGVTFGGFLVDKYISSQPNARPDTGHPDVANSGAAGAVPAISRPGVPVWDYITMPQAMIACCNRGKGWHLTSPFEWASVLFLAKKFGTQPHGGNADTDPPSDVSYPFETALKDQSTSYNRALPGTGPPTWAHNHHASGIYDLQGLVWQWVMMFMTTDGYPQIPANFDVSYMGSPYGRGTIELSGGTEPLLIVDGAGNNWLKKWGLDAFAGMQLYIAETAAFYGIVAGTPWAASTSYSLDDVCIPSDTATYPYRYKCTRAGTSGSAEPTWPTIIGSTVDDPDGSGAEWTCEVAMEQSLQLASASAPGNGIATFVAVKTIATDITAGMTSGNRILTLRDSDVDLGPLAIPAASDSTGSAVYGKDGYWFDKAEVRAALRGGLFNYGDQNGVCAVNLNYVPSNSNCDRGLRACKAL